MKKIYCDMISVSSIILISLLLWSTITTIELAQGLLFGLFMILIIINLFFIYKREMKSFFERIFYLFSFAIFSSIIVSFLIIDDTTIISGVLYFITSLLVVSVLAFLSIKWTFLKRFSFRMQNFIMWSLSFLLVLLSFTTVV